MKDEDKYEFQVAFSFLKEDEIVANAVNDLIQDRVKTFIYSKKQEGLVGFDGEEKFNEVFNKKSKLVVILFRQNWGQSPWTRIEMTAIKNRAFDNGYDFTIFVPLDKSQLPPWVPKTTIWYDFDRWGAKGLATVIESKLVVAGETLKKPESAIDFATRKKRELELRKEIEDYLKSADAYKDANNEFAKIVDKVNEHAKKLNELGLSNGHSGQVGREITIKAQHYFLTFHWGLAYANSLANSYLQVIISRKGNDWDERPFIRIESKEYYFSMNEIKRVGWSEKKEGEFYESDMLADTWTKELIKLLDR